MKQCHDIENLLPLYLEGILSDAEKRTVEEHLSGCVECQKELAYLQKAGDLVDQLPQVEEPPWFQQKIMARVREEAGKKSIVQKWFYPLRIKIPVQIMATIVVAILAVYIYRSGNEQVTEILPGVQKPAVEMQKEQAPVRMPQVEDQATQVIPGKKSTVREEATPVRMPRVKDRAMQVAPREKSAVGEEATYGKPSDKMDRTIAGNLTAGGRAQKSAVPESKPHVAYEADALSEKGFAGSKDEANEEPQTIGTAAKSAKAQMADQGKKEGDRSLSVMAKKRSHYIMAAPAAPQPSVAFAVIPPQIRVFIRVDNLNAAAPDVEKILVQYDAKKVIKQPVDGGVVIRAEVPGKHWKNVLSKLKKIGQVEEKDVPANISEPSINLMITISE